MFCGKCVYTYSVWDPRREPPRFVGPLCIADGAAEEGDDVAEQQPIFDGDPEAPSGQPDNLLADLMAELLAMEPADDAASSDEGEGGLEVCLDMSTAIGD